VGVVLTCWYITLLLVLLWLMLHYCAVTRCCWLLYFVIRVFIDTLLIELFWYGDMTEWWHCCNIVGIVMVVVCILLCCVEIVSVIVVICCCCYCCGIVVLLLLLLLLLGIHYCCCCCCCYYYWVTYCYLWCSWLLLCVCIVIIVIVVVGSWVLCDCSFCCS